MKMMSWSRYHCLSKSLLRAERRIALRRCSRPATQPRPASAATGAWRRLGSDPLFPICAASHRPIHQKTETMTFNYFCFAG